MRISITRVVLHPTYLKEAYPKLSVSAASLPAYPTHAHILKNWRWPTSCNSNHQSWGSDPSSPSLELDSSQG